MLRSQAQCLHKASDFFDKALSLSLFTILENIGIKPNVNALHSVFIGCYFLVYCVMVTLKYAENHEQERIQPADSLLRHRAQIRFTPLKRNIKMFLIREQDTVCPLAAPGS